MSPSLRLAVTAGVAGGTAIACVLLAQRAIAMERDVRGATYFANGDAVRATPYLIRSAGASWLAGLDARPMIDLAEVARWAMDDPGFSRFHRGIPPRAAARLAFLGYASALDRRPVSPAAYAGLADLLGRAEEMRSGSDGASALAEAAIRKAIELEPAGHLWHDELGDRLAAAGRRPEALASYAVSIEILPEIPWHHYLAPGGKLPADLFETARSAMTRALRSSGHPPDRIEGNLGALHAAQEDLDGALAHYRRAIALARDPSLWLWHVADLLARRGQLDDAIAYLTRALSRRTLGPGLRGAAEARLGRILLERRQWRQAVEHLERASVLTPRDAALRLDLGRAYHGAGRSESAEQQLRQAVELDPGQTEGWLLLMEIYRARGEIARAIPLARRLVETFPDEPRYREQLDDLYRRIGPELQEP